MLHPLLALILFFGANIPFSQPDAPNLVFAPADSIRFYDGLRFDIIGRFHHEKKYGRFPAKYEKTLRKEVWDLGEDAAGVSIRFRTDSRTIVVNWTVKYEAKLPHMPATGVGGVDLYANVGGRWQYVRTGIPKGKTTEQILLSGGDGVSREYLLNLPLYDGVDSLKIGIDAQAHITNAADKYLLSKKPVVYYGSSIAQGGCASRPGILFTNILSRKMDRSFINFGFSGNGRFETSVGEAMTEIDAALYVIDCNPNTDVELIYQRAIELVRMLKKQHSEVPILMVEGYPDESKYFNLAGGGNKQVERKNMELKKAFESLKKSGTTKLHYQMGDHLIGDDHEGTVDGIHPTDVGMMRIADVLLPVINKLL